MNKLEKLNNKIIAGVVVFLLVLFLFPISFFHQSILGKISLISLVIYFTWCNIFLGLISIIVFVLLHNNPFYTTNSSFLSHEPFTSTMTMLPDPSCNCVNSYDASGNCISLYDASGNCIKSYDASGNYIGSSSSSTYDKAKAMFMGPQEMMFDISGNIDIKRHPIPTEGFDLLGTEDTIRKGKQSNSIIVSKNAKTDSVLFPFENTKFIENFLIL